MLTSGGRNFRLCPSLPNASIIQAHMLWIEMYAEIEGQPVASASKISVASKRESAEPPTSSRT